MNRNGSAALIVMLIVIVILIVGGVWYFMARLSGNSASPIAPATQSSALPKTAEAMQAIQLLVQQNGISSLNTLPVSRVLHPASTTNFSTFSYLGITFNVPWKGISNKKENGAPVVFASITFTNGRSFTIMRALATSADDLNKFATLSSTITTEYALEDASLNATPGQVISSTPENQAVLTSLLLDEKILLLTPTPVYSFDTGIIKGFQHGDATPTKQIIVKFFDKKNNSYVMTIAGTQDEIDYILASVH